MTDVVRVDLDTAAAAGWNTYDAARLTGALDVPPSIILPVTTNAPGEENRVRYQPLVGVHGIDSFTYQVSDCMSYGAPATVDVVLPKPAAAFESAPFFAVSVTVPRSMSQFAPMQVALDVPQIQGTTSLYEKLSAGGAPITVELKGVRGGLSAIELLTGLVSTTISMTRPNATLLSKDWTARQVWNAHGGVGDAELWFSNGGALTFRTLLSVQRREPPLSCRPGSIVVTRGADVSCEKCAAGSFEHEGRVCLAADSFHYIPNPGSTREDAVPCSVNVTDPILRKQSSRLLLEEGQIRVIPTEGATSHAQCTCRSGAYSLISFEILDRYGGAAKDAASFNPYDPNGTIADLFASPLDCRRCPNGAICEGNILPPRARVGFGVLQAKGRAGNFSTAIGLQLAAGYNTFYPCLGEQRCSGSDLSDCDCLEGTLVTATHNRTVIFYQVSRCNEGYLSGSSLCSLCDSDDRYVSTLEECKSCDWPGVLYLIVAMVVVLTWFPFFTYISENFESLGTGPVVELATLAHAALLC
jgi:hypothetical protein